MGQMDNRLKMLRKELKMTQEALGKVLGITKSALSMIETGKQPLSERNKNIIVQELNVNPEWLASGKGEMFSANPGLRQRILRGSDDLPYQTVPLYDMQRAGGLAALLADPARSTPIDYIHIPNMPKCDGAVYVGGDGMYPLLNSGDIIIYKQMHDMDNIFWGDMYLLSVDVGGEEYVTVKYLRKSERNGYVKLSNYNPQHPDREIEISKIRAIAFIRASIRINTPM